MRLIHRSMVLADLSDILVIENVAHANPWTEKAFVDCIAAAAKGYVCQVVLNDKQIVGYVMLSVAVGEAHLLNITIAPEHQGLGLGRRWLNWVVGWAAGQKAQTMFLEVRAGNLVALALYESAGFNRIGLRRDYYPSLLGREDAIVMGLDLTELDVQEVTVL